MAGRHAVIDACTQVPGPHDQALRVSAPVQASGVIVLPSNGSAECERRELSFDGGSAPDLTAVAEGDGKQFVIRRKLDVVNLPFKVKPVEHNLSGKIDEQRVTFNVDCDEEATVIRHCHNLDVLSVLKRQCEAALLNKIKYCESVSYWRYDSVSIRRECEIAVAINTATYFFQSV